MQPAVSLRGFLPPLAAVAAATVLSASVPATAFATPVHPRTTTVDRTEGLDPEGDTVTVSGIGHSPGSGIEITTRAVPAEAARAGEADESAVLDTDNAVLTEVDERGLFTVELDTGVDFAAGAGLDTAEDPFEILLTEPAAAQDDAEGEPERDTRPGDDTPAEEPPSAEDEVVVAPGPGRSAPVLAPIAPVAPSSAPVVGVVPVSFAVPASAPRTGPPSVSAPRPQPQPQAQAAPQTLPRTPGAPNLTVSRTSGLDPDGERVTVTGTGYDTAKGVYVALCDTANASATQAPSPCIGGVDMEGEGGASVWVSSNPPPYGEGLATPYTGSGSNGGFTVELTVRGSDEHTDCLSAATDCAVVTRNDHTRSSDRGQDVFVPVTFGGQTGDPGSTGGSGSGSGSEGPDASHGTNGSGGGSGGSAPGGAGGPNPEGEGPLATTGTALTGLLLAAAVAALTGAVAMFAARRRGGPAPAPAT